MKKMVLERLFVGELDISNGFVDITDPYHDRNVWCRMNQIEVTPGTYNCYVFRGNDPFWGTRNWICQIVLQGDNNAEEKIAKKASWKKFGTIGVDAGLAGFFPYKPDFTYDKWSALCNWMLDKTSPINLQDIPDAYIKNFGFWSDSGYGDGAYEVYAIYDNKKIIAMEIRF